ncbi:MAG: hypothetical protein IJI97_01690 [Clostridia bacterium]|nr:hypothetical protein [Clostridia bacterium]
MKGAMATGLLVSRHLGACGFKRSVETSRDITGGFGVRDFRGQVSVRWVESLAETEDRMLRSRQSITDLPAHNDERAYLEAYADALRPRWDVAILGSSLNVTQKAEDGLFASKVFYRHVRQEIENSGAQLMSGYPGTVRSGVAVTREPGHVRIMVRPWIGWGPWEHEVVEEANQVIMRTVRQSGWRIIDCRENIEGFVIKVEEEEEK